MFRGFAFTIFVLLVCCASLAESGPLRAQSARSPSVTAFEAGDYAKSVKLQEDVVKRARPGAEAAAALLSLSWYRLFTHDFDGAIDASDRAIAIEPSNVVLYTNKAHALMFLGHSEAAQALYLKYRGRPIPNGKAFWEDVVLQDFAVFKKHGMPSPQMKSIEAALSQSRKKAAPDTLEGIYIKCLGQCNTILLLCQEPDSGSSCDERDRECRRRCGLYRH
jgi:hypothetical protein